MENKEGTLDWHSGVIFYKDESVYYFEPRLNMELEEFKSKTVQFKFRARLVDFIKNKRLPTKQIYVGGGGSIGNCRDKAMKFIKNIVECHKAQIKCTLYTFHEFVIGPRVPSRERNLEILYAIPKWQKLTV